MFESPHSLEKWNKCHTSLLLLDDSFFLFSSQRFYSQTHWFWAIIFVPTIFFGKKIFVAQLKITQRITLTIKGKNGKHFYLSVNTCSLPLLCCTPRYKSTYLTMNIAKRTLRCTILCTILCTLLCTLLCPLLRTLLCTILCTILCPLLCTIRCIFSENIG